MNDIILHAGDVVIHRDWGIGVVAAIEPGGTLPVKLDFKGRRQEMTLQLAQASLKVMPEDGLEAMDRKSHETLVRWSEQAPLKLVAVALRDIGKPAKAGSLAEAIEGNQILKTSWDAWWRRVQPALKMSPYFETKGVLVSLKSDVGDIPEIPWNQLSKPRRTAPSKLNPGGPEGKTEETSTRWLRWLLSDGAVELPGGIPAKIVFDTIDLLPQSHWQPTSDKLIQGIRSVLKTSEVSDARLESWSRLVRRFTQAATVNDNVSYRFAGDLAKVISRTSYSHLQIEAFEPLVLTLASFAAQSKAAMDGVIDAQNQAIVASPTGSAALVSGLVRALPLPRRKEFCLRLADSLVVSGNSEKVSLISNSLALAERWLILGALEWLAAQGRVSPLLVVNQIRREWEQTSVADRQRLLGNLIAAAVILGDEAKGLAVMAADSFGSLLGESRRSEASVVDALLETARSKMAKARSLIEESAARERTALEERAAAVNSERDMIRKHSDDLRAELATRRELSQLDIRRDMLLVAGETLQDLSGNDDLQKKLEDARAGLILILQAGGAELFGQVGQTTSYQTRLHQATEPLAEGTSVTFEKPGLIVRTANSADVVLLKARVKKGGIT